MYALHCHDPRYPLGYPADQDHDLSALQVRCDQRNAKALAEDGLEQFWIVEAGRIIYLPPFVSEAAPDEP